jgi:shikimate kinase
VKVYLIGMPGSGKSSVGSALARALGLPFVDLDREIEAADGRGIPRIFDEEGEAAFRALERSALERAAAGPEAVVACGGGIVLDPANRDRLRATGAVVWLSVPVDRLRERVRPGAGRPLVRDGADLERLAGEREDAYAATAHHVVDAAGDPERVAAAIARLLDRGRGTTP